MWRSVYAMLQKIYGVDPEGEKRRQNLTMRMSMQRFTGIADHVWSIEEIVGLL